MVQGGGFFDRYGGKVTRKQERKMLIRKTST